MKKIFALAAVMTAALASPAMAQDFTGPRIEARVGVDAANLGSGKAVSGLSYGVGVGYDVAVSERVRLGVEADLDNSTTDKKLSGVLRADAKRDIELGARLGYVVTPNVLLYTKAAYTNARTGYSLDTKTGRVTAGHQTGEGYRVGAGAELAVSKNLYAKAEYRYSDYGSGDRRNQIMGGVGLRF